jgi:hypothetical protein
MIPGFGLVRRLLFTALVLGGLFVFGNYYLTNQAEKRIGDAIEHTFNIDRVEVSIDDFPLVAHIFSGSIEHVTVTAHDVKLKGLHFASMRVNLRRLKLDGGLLGSGKLAVSVGHGVMSATTTTADIDAYLADHDQNATVELHPDQVVVRAVRTFAGARHHLVAGGRFELDRAKQVLRFVPLTVRVDGSKPPAALEAEAKRQATITITIPKLPIDIKADSVSTKEGAATVSADFRDRTLKIAG